MAEKTRAERTPKPKEEETGVLPILPVRDTVLFPHAVLPLTVGRESSVQLINSLGEDKTIVVVAQREARVDAPQASDLYTVGTLAVVHKVVKMPNQSLFVFAEGLERVRLADFVQLTPFMRGRVDSVPEAIPPKSSEVEALQRNVLTLFQQIVAGSPTLSDELSTVAMNIDEPGRLVDFIASSLPSLSTADKQDTLETTDVRVRLEKINHHLAKELEVQQLRNKIQSEVQDRVQQTQREYYLREQMKAIQKELGEQDEGARDTEELKQKIDNAGMPDEVKKEALKELGRLARMSPMAADYSVTRNYVEWLAALPWAKTSGGEVDILKAKEILDTDHYDLKKVKDRILDYLSVRRLKPGMKGPILCFVGPPGVGKTSLGKSIARADSALRKRSRAGRRDDRLGFVPGCIGGRDEGGLTHARRSDEAKNRALSFPASAAERKGSPGCDPYLFQVVVIGIQDFLGFQDVDFAAGSFRPRQRRQPLHIIAGDRIIRRHRGHPGQPAQFLQGFFLYFIRHSGVFDLLRSSSVSRAPSSCSPSSFWMAFICSRR